MLPLHVSNFLANIPRIFQELLQNINQKLIHFYDIILSQHDPK